jgi:hypothetical protein
MTIITLDPSQMEAVAALMRQTAAEYDSAALRVNATDTAACPPGLATTAADICTLLAGALAELANGLTAGAAGLESRANEAVVAGGGVATAGVGVGNAVAGYTPTGDPFADILNMEAALENDPSNTMTITWGPVPDPSSEPTSGTTITWGGVPDPSAQYSGATSLTGVDDFGVYSQIAADGQDGAWFGQAPTYTVVGTDPIGSTMSSAYAPLFTGSYVPSPSTVLANPPDLLYPGGQLGPGGVFANTESGPT